MPLLDASSPMLSRLRRFTNSAVIMPPALAPITYRSVVVMAGAIADGVTRA
ncbi:hypothetical protein [Gluconacetobacter sacchari]|uniref:hypothetical protein n=1 Tax=Gluconacetobacter sacchari TaxID=92759 RepID=UPI0022300F24|nr:hypothetical protein [Gluconacetobacter sacchari]